MNYLIVCNTGSDTISKISLEDYSVKDIALGYFQGPYGPSGIFLENNLLYTANSYCNTVSVINLNSFKEESSLYVGAHPNDLIKYDNYLYIACSESNVVAVYDLNENRIILDIAINCWPHNMEMLKDKKIIFVSNFLSNNVSVIDIETNKVVGDINTFEYPTKIKISKDNKYLYVCESYMGNSLGGYIEIFDLKNYKAVTKIKVGQEPMDINEDLEELYVCNFGEGTVSVIDSNSFKEVKKIYIGGMPKAIIKEKESICVSDYLNGRIIILSLTEGNRKVITVGKEPNAMTLY